MTLGFGAMDIAEVSHAVYSQGSKQKSIYTAVTKTARNCRRRECGSQVTSEGKTKWRGISLYTYLTANAHAGGTSTSHLPIPRTFP
jgi:hypothetical protein